MTHTPQHGRCHEIEFYAVPSNNEYLDGIAQVLHGPGATWLTHGGAHRCLHISNDKRTYLVVEIDIHILHPWMQNKSLSKYTKIVEINLTCSTCSTKYQTWRTVGDNWTQDRYWLYVDHCPACPPMSPDVWLAGLGYYPERPTFTDLQPRPAEARSKQIDRDVDMTDFT